RRGTRRAVRRGRDGRRARAPRRRLEARRARRSAGARGRRAAACDGLLRTFGERGGGDRAMLMIRGEARWASGRRALARAAGSRSGRIIGVSEASEPAGAIETGTRDGAEARGAEGRGAAVRLRIDLAYDGTRFHGWAAQPGL